VIRNRRAGREPVSPSGAWRQRAYLARVLGTGIGPVCACDRLHWQLVVCCILGGCRSGNILGMELADANFRSAQHPHHRCALACDRRCTRGGRPCDRRSDDAGDRYRCNSGSGVGANAIMAGRKRSVLRIGCGCADHSACRSRIWLCLHPLSVRDRLGNGHRRVFCRQSDRRPKVVAAGEPEKDLVGSNRWYSRGSRCRGHCYAGDWSSRILDDRISRCRAIGIRARRRFAGILFQAKVWRQGFQPAHPRTWGINGSFGCFRRRRRSCSSDRYRSGWIARAGPRVVGMVTG
jgi:hypothetical protein